ncbi:MAG: VOC family protein [Thermomicrobiales bacterium]
MTATVSIVPNLLVHDGPVAIAWYREAFGAAVAFRIEEGAEVFAMLTIGEARFFVATESPEHGNPGPRTLGGSGVRIDLLSDDPDTLHARAVEAGGTEISPVRDEEAGPRMGVVHDPFGHTWLIGALWDPRDGNS